MLSRPSDSRPGACSALQAPRRAQRRSARRTDLPSRCAIRAPSTSSSGRVPRESRSTQVQVPITSDRRPENRRRGGGKADAHVARVVRCDLAVRAVRNDHVGAARGDPVRLAGRGVDLSCRGKEAAIAASAREGEGRASQHRALPLKAAAAVIRARSSSIELGARGIGGEADSPRGVGGSGEGGRRRT